MKVFMDFEYTGLHQHTTPISVGLVAEDGNEFYAEFTDYDPGQVDDWIKEHVISGLQLPSLEDMPCPEGAGPVEAWGSFGQPLTEHWKGSRPFIAKRLRSWLQERGAVEMWGDCLAYDWMLFCELFGGTLNIPNVYYIPFDLATLFKLSGIDPDIDREEFAGTKSIMRHNALHDARTIKMCYERVASGSRAQPSWGSTGMDGRFQA